MNGTKGKPPSEQNVTRDGHTHGNPGANNDQAELLRQAR